MNLLTGKFPSTTSSSWGSAVFPLIAMEHLLAAPATPAAAAALFLGVSLGTQASKFSYFAFYMLHAF